jgi:hypothetical protein
VENMNLTPWKSKYLRTSWGNESMLIVASVWDWTRPAENCWRGMLYNYTQAMWEDKLPPNPNKGGDPIVCGTPFHAEGDDGWTLWEPTEYFGCPTIASVKSYNIKVQLASGWTSLANRPTSQRGGSLQCWNSFTYTWVQDDTPIVGPEFNWRARTPN